jgi:hypothetical protein
MKNFLNHLFRTAIATIGLFVICWTTATKLNATVYEAYDYASYVAAITAVNNGSGGDVIKITGDIVITGYLSAIENKDVTITSDTNPDGSPKYTMSDGGGGYNTSIELFCLERCTIENITINDRYGINVRLYKNDPGSYPVVKINNCVLNNIKATGINITGIESKINPVISITNCKINNSANSGIYIGDHPPIYDITIQNCTIIKSTSSTSDGIHIRTGYANSNPASKLNIVDCIVNDYGNCGIYIMGDGGVIKNCTTNNNHYYGINCRANARLYNCVANGNENEGININTNYNSGDFSVSDTVIIKNCTTNNNYHGIRCSNDAIVEDCISNDNKYSGFYLGGANKRSCGTKFNNCTAQGNGNYGFYLPERPVISNCVAIENGFDGFRGDYMKVTNCSAIRNGSYGFFLFEFSLVNKCSAIENGQRDSYYGDGFHDARGSIIINSLAINNPKSGFGKSGRGGLINCTAYNNATGVNSNNNTLNIYNSIIYGSKDVDFYPSSHNDVVYNTVLGTEKSGATKQDCTTDDPKLIWLKANGDITNNIEEATHYTLGDGSSASGLANMSFITGGELINLFDPIMSAENFEYMKSLVTEEYVSDILVFDRLGNPRGFNGDRYDAGCITGNSQISDAILSYAPQKAANYGASTIVFYGYGFNNSTKVLLKRAGEPDIIADTIISESINSGVHTKCSATFNIHDKKLGLWDIIVKLSDTTITIKEGFELEKYIKPEIEVEIVGPANLSNKGWSNYTIKYTNMGNVDVCYVPMIIAITYPPDVKTEVKVGWIWNEYDDIDEKDILRIDSYTDQDTGEIITLIPVDVPYISANGKGYLNFSVRFSATNGIPDVPVKIRVIPMPPMIVINPDAFEKEGGSKSFIKDGMMNLGFSECVAATVEPLADVAAELVGAFIPPVGCAYSIMDLKHSQDNKKYDNFAWDIFSTLTCVLPAGVGTGAKIAWDLVKGISGSKTPGGYFHSLKEKGDERYKICGRDKERDANILTSKDPNDKCGPVSESGSTWFSDREEFTYVINFENDPEATAPAQQVWVTDNLDLNVYDINTFEAGILKIGNRIIETPPGLQNYTWIVDMRPEMELITEISLKLDKSKGIATWYFKSIDPATGELPTDALMGFLPPNDDEGSGQGFVMFSIKLKKNLPDDAVIANKASIVFDYNDPILTPEWVNERDVISPASTILRPAKVTGEIELKWQGTDNSGGSGVWCYDIYMKQDNGDYEMIAVRTTATSMTFTVEEDIKYSFYSIATDHAGNREPDKTKPDISIPFNDLPFDTYAATKWNNTVMLNLKKLSADGYDVTACTWFKNSQPIGEGFTYSAGPNITDQLETGAVYYFQLTTRNGDELYSTNKIIGAHTNSGLRAYPNPVSQGNTLTVEGTTQGSLVEIYNSIGMCVGRTIATGNVTELTLALPTGIYIVRSNNERVKVIIK